MFSFPNAKLKQNFVADYWQRQPLLIPEALSHQTEVISSEALFELACNDEVESRLIFRNPESGDYCLNHGPQDIQQLNDLVDQSDWTLLVQSVNLWSEAVASIIDDITFVPHWRYDDIMISISGPGGGVGPHTDNYDVFLLQLDGTRRWRVGHRDEYQLVETESTELKLIEPFEATIEETLAPGDVLYVPPKTPHEGVSITTGMTLSIGFRSPSHAEFAMMLAEELSELDRHYEDSAEDSLRSVSEISTDAMHKARDWFTAGIDDLFYFRAFGKLQTQPKQELLLFPVAGDAIEILRSGDTLHRDPAARIAWWIHIDSIYVFVNGEEKQFTADNIDMVNQLSVAQDIDLDMISAYIGKNNVEEVLMFLTDSGFYGTIE